MTRVARGAGERLAAALRDALPPFAGSAEVALLASESWTSITFAGGRHRLRLELSGADAGAAADALIAMVQETEPELRGHLVVDIRLLQCRHQANGTRVELELAAITIEKD
jgi:hypothetical protein